VSSVGCGGLGKTARAGTLVLSPHADDAALSLGGCLHAAVLPAPVTIVTVFGESNFMNGAFHSDVAAVTGRRKAEDRAFAAAAGVGLLFWSNAEAALRPSDSRDGVFAAGFDVPLEEPADLAARLESLLVASPPELMLSPLGLGFHVDHLLVQRLAARLSSLHGIPLAYYEDLPYAAAMPIRSIRARALGIDSALRPWVISIPGELTGKMTGLAHYSSQIDAADLARVMYHACRRSWLARARRWWPGSSIEYPIERIWNHGYQLPRRFRESPHS
jgi:LmbE family N-acetylglucosaminyl deacetylase